MNIHELRSQPHLSASSIGTYIECGLQYYFGRVECLPAEFTSSAMLFGSAIHRVLETFYRELQSGITLSLSELKDIFEEVWMNMTAARENIQYNDGKDADVMLLEGTELLSVYYNNLPDDEYTILGIEQPFAVRIEGIPVALIGVWDLVIEDTSGVITIVDHKTSSRAFSIDEINSNFQMSVYNLAIKQNEYADRDVLLRFDTLIKTKRPKFEMYYTTRSEEDDRRTIKQIKAVWKGIEKEIFTPNFNSWRCKNCEFASACNDWALSEAA